MPTPPFDLVTPWPPAGGGGGGAPTDAEYVVATADGDLSAERVATDTATVAWDTGTAGQIKANVPDDSITFAKMANLATDKLVGRDTAGTGDPEALGLDSTLEFDGSGNIRRAALTGDVTASAGSNATTIANDAVTTAKILDEAVTLAKIQDIATDRILGRDAAGSGVAEELSLVGGLEFTGAPGFRTKSRVLDRMSTPVTISNTTAETTIYSTTIGAGVLGANDEIALKILSEFTNNTGSGRGWIVKVKLGGTTVINFDGSNTWASVVTPRLSETIITLSSLGATNSQVVLFQMSMAGRGGLLGSWTTGTGNPMSPDYCFVGGTSGTLSQDMTSSKTLEVTITLSTNSTNLTWKAWSGTMELKAA